VHPEPPAECRVPIERPTREPTGCQSVGKRCKVQSGTVGLVEQSSRSSMEAEQPDLETERPRLHRLEQPHGLLGWSRHVGPPAVSYLTN
jgi:hypothetical protein